MGLTIGGCLARKSKFSSAMEIHLTTGGKFSFLKNLILR